MPWGPPCHPAAAALLAVRDAVSNWAAATSGLGGAAWQDGGSPCGAGGQGPWPGVTCNTAGQVTALNLTGLGLEGTLPAALAGLTALAALDLSANKFRGALPAAWLQQGALPQLAVARLGDNLLGGGLGRRQEACGAGVCRRAVLHQRQCCNLPAVEGPAHSSLAAGSGGSAAHVAVARWHSAARLCSRVHLRHCCLPSVRRLQAACPLACCPWRRLTSAWGAMRSPGSCPPTGAAPRCWSWTWGTTT